jgi:methylenetetrahydrofolate dehydrogenase (NADP+) / methenyltetrahydrofolate cyclohydrolase
MDGRALAARVRAAVAEEAPALAPIRLATVLVGDDPASHLYIARKHDAAKEVGIEPLDHRFPADVSEAEVVALVARLNADDEVDAVLPQLPLPGGIDEARVIRAVDPTKDVDGFHPFNAGQLYLGRPTLVPATPLGIMALLEAYGVRLDGARAVVVGRSDIVGKPAAHLLLQANATVSICHSHTDDLAGYTLDADVLVVAGGSPSLVRAEMVKQGAVVVDVGQNRTDAGLVGDVDAAAAEVAGLITPVPGGVGPMTIAMLLRNTVLAARYRRGLLAFA